MNQATTASNNKTMPKQRAHTRPVYLKNKPYYLVKIPWVATTGMPECPCEYNNGLHAAVSSIIAAMQMDELCHAVTWMKEARRQLNHALRATKKPGASVPVVGKIYDYPENVPTLAHADENLSNQNQTK